MNENEEQGFVYVNEDEINGDDEKKNNNEQ
jgi:hypothetical protein